MAVDRHITILATIATIMIIKIILRMNTPVLTMTVAITVITVTVTLIPLSVLPGQATRRAESISRILLFHPSS